MKRHRYTPAQLKAFLRTRKIGGGSTPAPMTIDQVNAQADLLEQAQVKAFADAQQFIADLKAQVAAGTAVTPSQLDALGQHLKALTDATIQFDINNSEPVAPIPPPATA